VGPFFLMSESKIPLYSRDLIKQLDEEVVFDPPKLNESERSIFHRAGMRALVDRLKIELAESNELDPEDSILDVHVLGRERP